MRAAKSISSCGVSKRDLPDFPKVNFNARI
jgi:hypothetical protein